MESKTPVQPSYTDEQILVWLRGLLTIAWADGDFDPSEQQLITSLTHHELAKEERSSSFQPVGLEELSIALGQDPKLAENFLRTAVMVALADGIYTSTEDEILERFCRSLGYGTEILETLRLTLYDLPREALMHTEITKDGNSLVASPYSSDEHLDLLHPAREWLDHLEIHDPKIAHFLCKMIPAQCPFERDITLFGHKVVHIPPMCKLNPLYEQLVGLRFRALSYLADECGEDVSVYC